MMDLPKINNTNCSTMSDFRNIVNSNFNSIGQYFEVREENNERKFYCNDKEIYTDYEKYKISEKMYQFGRITRVYNHIPNEMFYGNEYTKIISSPLKKEGIIKIKIILPKLQRVSDSIIITLKLIRNNEIISTDIYTSNYDEYRLFENNIEVKENDYIQIEYNEICYNEMFTSIEFYNNINNPNDKLEFYKKE